MSDLRRRNRYEKQQKRFQNHQPRTFKDQMGFRNEGSKSNIKAFKLNRKEIISLAQETLRLTDISQTTSNDETETSNDETENIILQLQKEAIKSTKTYDLKGLILLQKELKLTKKYETEFDVQLESTLDGAFRLFHAENSNQNTETNNENPNMKIGVLNFASAKNPGGGFLKGSMAQEESLTLSSGLYGCIKDSSMYEINRNNPRRGLYNNSMIYSENVPIFRDSKGEILPNDSIYTVNFLTVPAVNWGDAQKKGVTQKSYSKSCSKTVIQYCSFKRLFEKVLQNSCSKSPRRIRHFFAQFS